jgi:hypothetical protein
MAPSRGTGNLVAPVVFPLVMAGGGVRVLGMPLPGVETGIALSAIALGAMVALQQSRRFGLLPCWWGHSPFFTAMLTAPSSPSERTPSPTPWVS